ncbi:Phospholipase A(2) [Trichostrongylus colubriformis]|uniref:Phospholipase A2 n=1 Tax=Trichostrongylus colubriformis TaxID=6319 RepID=A0AAN8ISF0_TRICO
MMYRAITILALIPLLHSVPALSKPTADAVSAPLKPINGSVHLPHEPLVGALWNLGLVGECVLHYNPLCYNNYGCWCGVGGSHEPVDDIDRCCMHHDKCYDDAVDKKLCFDVAWEYIDSYRWQCTNSTATCLDDHPCKKALCACDVAVVQCWAQYPKPTARPHCNRSKLVPKSKYFQH